MTRAVVVVLKLLQSLTDVRSAISSDTSKDFTHRAPGTGHRAMGATPGRDEYTYRKTTRDPAGISLGGVLSPEGTLLSTSENVLVPRQTGMTATRAVTCQRWQTQEFCYETLNKMERTKFHEKLVPWTESRQIIMVFQVSSEERVDCIPVPPSEHGFHQVMCQPCTINSHSLGLRIESTVIGPNLCLC